MDIRVAAYRPGVTVQSFSAGNRVASTVSNAQTQPPVSAVAPVSSYRSQPAQDPLTASTDGYTDATRGTRVNILA